MTQSVSSTPQVNGAAATSGPTGTLTPDAFLLALREGLGEDAVRSRLSDLARMGHDASHYLLHPRAVVMAQDAPTVARAVAIAARHQVPVTFRSGGTSLSGQAVTDGLLIDTRRSFRGIKVLDGGGRVRCQPGATVRAVNTALAPYQRALGPDPASESACTIGGVVANNSSGMACGTTRNTYRTLDSLEVALLSGTVIDTGARDADERLRSLEPALWQGLARLRDRVRGNPDSVRRITHQFSMKNTMGYGVNSFLDHDRPVDILTHLMIGSEGTLGFIMSATFTTVPVYPFASTALLVFDDILPATRALPALVGAGAATAELMDAASLRVAQQLPKVVPALVGLGVQAHTALLVEAQSEHAAELAELVHGLSCLLPGLEGMTALAKPAAFSEDPVERADAWLVRKGLYTAVAGARPAGSTALLEDVVVPMPALPDMVRDIGVLCHRFGYDDAVIFGHAKDANLHFMINPDLRDHRQVDTYATFSDALVDMVLAADGSLKAEHGTGRIMAPFVQRQYGSELYAVMREVKDLFDPGRVLNPGVIITDNPQQHLQDLKIPELVDEAVDRCVECGYCEPVCPSKDVTTTPRQRIVLMREMAAADPARRAQLEQEFSYDAVQTCAVDSLCLLACPVAIDTGLVMKGFRAKAQPPAAQRVGSILADHWDVALSLLRAGVATADRVPAPALTAVTSAGRSVISPDLLPLVGDDLPGPGVSRATSSRQEPGDVVLFASCMGELFEAAQPQADALTPKSSRHRIRQQGAAFAFLRLCDKAGVKVQLPEGLEGLCCGTVWRSKGLVDGRSAMALKTANALLRASRDGAVPIVTDASSCTHGLHEVVHDLQACGQEELAARVAALTIMDATRFVAQEVLPKLSEMLPDPARGGRRLGAVVVHPTCSDQHAGNTPYLLALAQACAELVVVPDDAGCCGFAGDRGMLHPELTASATVREAAEVVRQPYDAYLSSNRTCELGMSRATGHTYRHVLELLDDVTG